MVDLSNENEEKKKKESLKHKQWKIFGFLYSIYFFKVYSRVFFCCWPPRGGREDSSLNSRLIGDDQDGEWRLIEFERDSPLSLGRN